MESEEFEDWLQETLSRSSCGGKMYFCIGTSYDHDIHEFGVFGESPYISDCGIIIKLPGTIALGSPDAYSAKHGGQDPTDVNRYNNYIDAMDTCYKKLVVKLNSFGLKVVSCFPRFKISYHDEMFNVCVEFNNGD